MRFKTKPDIDRTKFIGNKRTRAVCAELSNPMTFKFFPFAKAVYAPIATSQGLCPNPPGSGGELNPAAAKKLLEVGPGHTHKHLHPLLFSS